MRRYIIATLCLATIFTAFGCGDKKSGSKAAIRARSGAHGTTKPVETTNNDEAPQTQSLEDKQKAEACLNTVKDIPTVDGEENVPNLASLIDTQKNQELVLQHLEVFYEKSSNTATHRVQLKSKGFADDTLESSLKAANENTKIVCGIPTDKYVALPNRINIKTGDYNILRIVTLSDEKKDDMNSFSQIALSNVAADEGYTALVNDEKNAQHTFSKDAQGNFYWRYEWNVKNEKTGETETIVWYAKYQPRDVVAIIPSYEPTSKK